MDAQGLCLIDCEVANVRKRYVCDEGKAER